MEKTGHWFRAISESEPTETYLKRAASDLGELSDSGLPLSDSGLPCLIPGCPV